MDHDYFADLQKRSDEFTDCLVEINEKNKNILLECLDKENQIISEIRSIMQSKVFSRAVISGKAKTIGKYLKEPLLIGHSQPELNNILNALDHIMKKQLEYEKCISGSAIQGVDKDISDKLGSLMHSDRFIRYYMETHEGKA